MPRRSCRSLAPDRSIRPCVKIDSEIPPCAFQALYAAPYAEGGVNVPQNEWFSNQVPASVLEQYTAIVDAMNAGEITVSTAYGASTEEIDAMKALASGN